jgi:hypothetical protein
MLVLLVRITCWLLIQMQELSAPMMVYTASPFIGPEIGKTKATVRGTTTKIGQGPLLVASLSKILLGDGEFAAAPPILHAGFETCWCMITRSLLDGVPSEALSQGSSPHARMLNRFV